MHKLQLKAYDMKATCFSTIQRMRKSIPLYWKVFVVFVLRNKCNNSSQVQQSMSSDHYMPAHELEENRSMRSGIIFFYQWHKQNFQGQVHRNQVFIKTIKSVNSSNIIIKDKITPFFFKIIQFWIIQGILFWDTKEMVNKNVRISTNK